MEENLEPNNDVNNEISDNTSKSNSEGSKSSNSSAIKLFRFIICSLVGLPLLPLVLFSSSIVTTATETM